MPRRAIRAARLADRSSPADPGSAVRNSAGIADQPGNQADLVRLPQPGDPAHQGPPNAAKAASLMDAAPLLRLAPTKPLTVSRLLPREQWNVDRFRCYVDHALSFWPVQRIRSTRTASHAAG